MLRRVYTRSSGLNAARRTHTSQLTYAQKVKPGTRTINKSLTALTMIFNYAMRNQWVDRNPADYVESLARYRLEEQPVSRAEDVQGRPVPKAKNTRVYPTYHAANLPH